METLSTDAIAIMDTNSARMLGNRKLGSLSSLVSQYNVSDSYSQINYQGTPVKVATLDYAGFFKYIKNRKESFVFMLHEKLTKSDVKKIQEEIEYRKLVIRKEALESVKEARAHGDLSENFEYKAAKQYKNKNEGRIRYLEKLLKNAAFPYQWGVY